MGTQKPLQEMIPEILQHVNNHVDFMEFNLRLYEILEGQLQPEVEKSLRREILSESAFRRIKERIPPINILRKGTDKLSKVYVEPPKRLADNKADQEIMTTMVKEGSLDTTMVRANRFYNASNMFAIEPFVQDRKHQFRVLSGHQFIPYSDDPSNPHKMTVFVKFLGSEMVVAVEEFDDSGLKHDREEVREVNIYALYSDDEFLIIDSGGSSRPDKMAEMGVTSTKNEFGKIPFIYKQKSNLNELVPFPNKEGFDMSILIPKLLADLNYSSQFQSHSIIWSKNTELEGKEINPDTVVDLGEGNGEGGEPEIGVIKPEVDIENILALIDYQMKAYFSSIGIKFDNNGAMANGRDSSAIGKAIDEADTTSAGKEQMEVFRGVEEELWDLMTVMQRVWANSGMVNENRRFSKDFAEDFHVQYSEMRPIKTFSQKVQEVRELRAEKLMSRKQALRHINPDLTEENISKWVKELDAEAEEIFEKQMTLGINIGPERKPDGTFQDGNQAGADQDETSKDETDVDERASTADSDNSESN